MALPPGLGETLACLQATAQLTALLGTVLLACKGDVACQISALSSQRQQQVQGAGSPRSCIAAGTAAVRKDDEDALKAQPDADDGNGTEEEGSAAARPSTKPAGEQNHSQSKEKPRQRKVADEEAAVSKKSRAKDNKKKKKKKEKKEERQVADAAGAAASKTRAAEPRPPAALNMEEEHIPHKRQKQRDQQQHQDHHHQQQQLQLQQEPRSDPQDPAINEPHPARHGQPLDGSRATSGHHAANQAGVEGTPAGAACGVAVAATEAESALKPLYSHWSAEDVVKLVACIEDAAYRRQVQLPQPWCFLSLLPCSLTIRPSPLIV